LTGLQEVPVAALPLARFLDLVGAERYRALETAAGETAERLDGHTIWNVNSTASGGGVAEMLRVLVGYSRGAGLDVRWLVTQGDPEFFDITKRIHNRIHGVRGDDGDLGPAQAAHYESTTRANAALLRAQVRPGDIVLLHDPQTAGLCDAVRDHGARVVWRCHIGADHDDEWTEQAWSFLLPHLARADAYIFSRLPYAPAALPSERVHVIPPSIDPFSPKNRELDQVAIDRIIRSIGLFGESGRAAIVGDGPLDPALPLVLQVSRWDHLKDMYGVMMGFARGVVGTVDANLALVGPSVAGVADDPEGAQVLHECVAGWRSLPTEARARIRLVSLPLDDIDENALMVNALQRSSTVVVQKSLAEGFGLTVAEAMWKARAVVASATGGIVDQVAPGTGVLLGDPRDLDAFGRAVSDLVRQPDEIARLGANARAHIVDRFVGDRHLLRYAMLLAELLDVSSTADRSA
jgi:trehalose synthase